MEDYALTPDLSAVRRMIKYAFGSYSSYLGGVLDPDLDKRVPASEYVARAYLRIANLGGVRSGLPDRRSSTIEVAYDKNVPLAGHAVLVVLPDALLQPCDPDTAGGELKQRLDALAVNYETYTWTPGLKPDEQIGEVDTCDPRSSLSRFASARRLRSGLRFRLGLLFSPRNRQQQFPLT